MTWLWDKGYEVFVNAGGDGCIDIVGIDPEGVSHRFDVKTFNMKHMSGRARSQLQKDLDVEIIWFEPFTRSVGFTQEEAHTKAKSRLAVERIVKASSSK